MLRRHVAPTCCLLLAAGCTPVQFDSERHAALVAPHHLAEGNTGKPAVAPKRQPIQNPPALDSETASRGERTGEDALERTRPASSGSEPREPSPERTGDSARSPERRVAAAPSGFLPDPPPRVSRQHWVFDVEYDQGAVRVDFVERRALKEPAPTPRLMGRFSLEFWVGRELLERVRFDFPLLGGEAGDPSLQSSVGLASGVRARRRVQVAQVPRATRVQLVDRATGDVQHLPWPPQEFDALPER